MKRQTLVWGTDPGGGEGGEERAVSSCASVIFSPLLSTPAACTTSISLEVRSLEYHTHQQCKHTRQGGTLCANLMFTSVFPL